MAVCLWELIKFDMQQIQNYREAVLDVSITITVASFAVTAFFFKKENDMKMEDKAKILILSNVLMMLIVSFTMQKYFEGIDGSRKALEVRQDSLKAYVDKKIKTISSEMLYPELDKRNLKWRQPEMKSELEKYPLCLAMLILIAKTAAEIYFVYIITQSKNQRKKQNKM